MSDSQFAYVQAKERSKSGKSWKLQLNGKWLSVSNRANMDGVEQGVYVEYQLGGFPGNDGKFIETVDRIRPAQAPAGSTPPSTAGVSKLKAALWDDSSLRFISNIVGSAITANRLESPLDVKVWTLAAEQALLSLQGEHQGPTEAPASSQSGGGENEQGWDDLAPPSKGSAVVGNW